MIIRLFGGYDGAILEVIEDLRKEKSPNDGNSIYWRLETGMRLERVPEKEVRLYFVGQADGLGYEKIPLIFFGLLEEAIIWIKKAFCRIREKGDWISFRHLDE